MSAYLLQTDPELICKAKFLFVRSQVLIYYKIYPNCSPLMLLVDSYSTLFTFSFFPLAFRLLSFHFHEFWIRLNVNHTFAVAESTVPSSSLSVSVLTRSFWGLKHCQCNMGGRDAVFPFVLLVGVTVICSLEGAILKGCFWSPVQKAREQAQIFSLATAKLFAFSQALCSSPINSSQEKSPLEETSPEQCGHKPVKAVWSQSPYYLVVQVVILKFHLSQCFCFSCIT